MDDELRVLFETNARALEVRDLGNRVRAGADRVAGSEQVPFTRRDELIAAVLDEDVARNGRERGHRRRGDAGVRCDAAARPKDERETDDERERGDSVRTWR